jgi:hypothetical protein
VCRCNISFPCNMSQVTVAAASFGLGIAAYVAELSNHTIEADEELVEPVGWPRAFGRGNGSRCKTSMRSANFLSSVSASGGIAALQGRASISAVAALVSTLKPPVRFSAPGVISVAVRGKPH